MSGHLKPKGMTRKCPVKKISQILDLDYHFMLPLFWKKKYCRNGNDSGDLMIAQLAQMKSVIYLSPALIF